MSGLRWDTNALTSTVHLIEKGRPLCSREVILAGEDEGGYACGHCVRIALQRDRSMPKRATA